MDTQTTDKAFDARLMLKAAIASAALATAGAGLTGCNTTEGLGEDVEAAGDAISDTAEDASD